MDSYAQGFQSIRRIGVGMPVLLRLFYYQFPVKECVRACVCGCTYIWESSALMSRAVTDEMSALGSLQACAGVVRSFWNWLFAMLR